MIKSFLVIKGLETVLDSEKQKMLLMKMFLIIVCKDEVPTHIFWATIRLPMHSINIHIWQFKKQRITLVNKSFNHCNYRPNLI